MLRHAIGIIEHPVTHQWQPFIYAEDGKSITLACTSKHSSRALAHLFVTIILDVSQKGTKVNLADLIKTNTESDLPDPLPQEVTDVLIADIQHTAHSSLSDTVIGFW